MAYKLPSYFQTLVYFCLFFLVIAPARSESRTSVSLQPVQLEITTHLGDDQSFRQGDPIRFMISLDKPAYVALFYQDANFELTQLLPNARRTSSFFKAGLYIPFPDQTADFELTAQAPFGVDRVWAFASDVPIATLEGQVMESGLKHIQLTIDQIRSIVMQGSKALYDEALLILTTSEK